MGPPGSLLRAPGVVHLCAREAASAVGPLPHLGIRLLVCVGRAYTRDLVAGEAISALLHGDVEAADRMVARLGDFLRLTLDNSDNQEVTLEQELEFLRCYLDIELTRFQDRLTVDLDMAPDTLTAQTPNLILQPIL